MPTEHKNWHVQCRVGLKTFPQSLPYPLPGLLPCIYPPRTSCCLLTACSYSMLSISPPLRLCQWHFFCLDFPKSLLYTLNSYSYFDTHPKSYFLYGISPESHNPSLSLLMSFVSHCIASISLHAHPNKYLIKGKDPNLIYLCVLGP